MAADCEGILHPEVVITAAEVIGNISAWQMPYNVQNAIGNWLMLLGQAIVTFNAQQQYCMNGPGPCFGEKASTQTSAQTASQERSSIEQRLDLLEGQMAELREQLSEQRLSSEWQLLEQLCRNLTLVQQPRGNNPF